MLRPILRPNDFVFKSDHLFSTKDMDPTFSLIIPTLNDAGPLEGLLAQVRRVQGPNLEVIVSDGGSTDATMEIARSAGVTVTLGKRGRGQQLNRGARLARGRVLVFVHADSVLPEGFDRVLSAHFAASKHSAAAFRVRFEPPHPLLRFSSWWSRFDTVFTRYGDQGLALTRPAFDRVGGYPDWPLMEDVEICRRLRRFTRVPALPVSITTSSRRFFGQGVARRQWANRWNMLRFLLGASPWALAAEYDTARPKPLKDGLILFVRLPVPGKVKTRLAAGIGPDRAAEVYRRLAEGALAQAQAAGDVLRTYVFVADPLETEAVRTWLGPHVDVLAQAQGDLGTRMADAFETVFSFGHGRTLIAGTDVPGLKASHFRRALEALDRTDLVIGPALDGGYYLLGQKRQHPELFTDMPWSGPAVLERTLAAAGTLGLSSALLEALEDVDNVAALERCGLNEGL